MFKEVPNGKNDEQRRFIWRIAFIVVFVAGMTLAVSLMFIRDCGQVKNGILDLTDSGFEADDIIRLDGFWEFYWDSLYMPSDFADENMRLPDSYMKVPAAWSDGWAADQTYPEKGVATYRMVLKYPRELKDPAVSMKIVSASYRLFAEGQLVAEVGTVSDDLAKYQGDCRHVLAFLPENDGETELVLQVANLSYARGGIRESAEFGSREALENSRNGKMTAQLIFIGFIFGFGIFNLIVFSLDRKAFRSLVFGLLCFTVAIRGTVWGVIPIQLVFPDFPVKAGLFINYLTLYNQTFLMLVFVMFMFNRDFNMKIRSFLLLPMLFFELLLFAPSGIRPSFNSLYYIYLLFMMSVMFGILTKAIMRKREYSILFMVVVGIFNLTIILDFMVYLGLSAGTATDLFLYGNVIVAFAVSYIQAKQKSEFQKYLKLYYDKSVEMDRLKEKIQAIEMAFLQAQIKPHFLYNALDAIANACEKDGKKGSELILDLAVYLRGSFEFNNMDKTQTLEKEIEFIDTYFNIEKERFGEKIRLVKEIEVPLGVHVPILVLQPIVENAVRHGISKKIGGGTVWITIREADSRILIEICDDGMGIDEEKLESLLDDGGADQRVGLINIHHRLLKLYGRGLEITGRPEGGTCVRIALPKGGSKNDTDSGSRR